jgi:predicted O-linked N-acetylglucosamine transferase (SPINDLY family)
MVIHGILKEDPDCIIAMLKGDNEDLLLSTVNRLESRLTKDDMDRICIISRSLELLEFSFYVHSCDVILDTFPFGGLISTFDTLSAGRCMLAMPGVRLGKFTRGMYERMGDPLLLEHLIANDTENYVKKAIKVANDIDLRTRLEGIIRDNLKKIHEDDASSEEWAEFLLEKTRV